MDLDILSTLLARPVSIYDLSARFSIDDIRRLEYLGFLCRVGDDYRITPAGRERIVVLSDLASDIERLSRQHAEQEAKENAQREKDSAQAALHKQQDRRDQYICVALGSALTLFLEHLPDIIDFVQLAIEKALSLFH